MENKEVPGFIGLRAISCVLICFFHALVARESTEYVRLFPFISAVYQKLFLCVEIFLMMAGWLSA